ncbi:pyridoxamine 5'-phosphate oxidase family protein [Mucilaginibacter koreensis]
MDYEKDLKKLETIDFLRDKINGIRSGMLTTFTTEKGFQSRPMGTAEVDVDGNIWFFTNEYSSKVEEISHENKVSLTYSDKETSFWLSIKGVASLVDDRQRMHDLWNPFIEAYFPAGIDDPKLILLKIDPMEAEYWEGTSSKIALVFQMIKSAVTGKPSTGTHEVVDL